MGADWTGMLGLLSSSLGSSVQMLQGINSEILQHSGKMLRPMISLLIAKALGPVSEDTIRCAAATELLHNATLMHDDVADDSSLRRGRPTLRAMYGPSVAVLVGDFWLSKAVRMVYDTSMRDKAIECFSQTLSALAEGEIFQMEKAETCDTSEEDYIRIITCKTASLFAAAGTTAAASVGADERLIEAAKEYSNCFGIAFQIKDDILDYAGTPELGKPLGSDLREQKITLPLLGAFCNASPSEENSIRSKLRDIHSHPEYCSQISDFVRDREGIEYASRKLREYIDRAESALGQIPPSSSKDYLMEIAEYNSFRQI